MTCQDSTTRYSMAVGVHSKLNGCNSLHTTPPLITLPQKQPRRLLHLLNNAQHSISTRTHNQRQILWMFSPLPYSWWRAATQRPFSAKFMTVVNSTQRLQLTTLPQKQSGRLLHFLNTAQHSSSSMNFKYWWILWSVSQRGTADDADTRQTSVESLSRANKPFLFHILVLLFL